MITYTTTKTITSAQFVDVLKRSTLAERRPVDNASCIEDMLKHADILATAWQGEKLVGIARSVTDFSYCCYLSDLAVDQSLRATGIGKALIDLTQKQLGENCKIILLAAPDAVGYYPHIGFEHHPQAWLLRPK